jgi:hypothetical protein
MDTKSQFLTELLIILSAFGFIFFYTAIYYLLRNLYRTFNTRFGKRVAKDVEKESLESWESKDS